MNQKHVARLANGLFSLILLLSLLASGSEFNILITAKAQESFPKSGGGAIVTDTNDARLIAVGSFDIQYLLLKQTVSLWSDGRGDVILERNIRNVGTVSGTSTTWYFDWYSGEYSNILAWDNNGPLQYSTTLSGTRIYITVEFRKPVLPNQTYDFSLAITINNMASGSGNDWEAYWYTYPGFPVQEFVQGITFPSNSTIKSIYPTPTTQNLNYLEWKYNNTPENWIDTIDVFYTLSSSIGVPLFLQTDPLWANKPYGNPINDIYSDNTIGNYGCYLTSTAMIIDYWGQRKSPAFHTDPDVLNTWMRNHDGYDRSNGVVPSQIVLYASNNQVTLSFLGKIDGRNDTILDNFLLSGNPVIIKVTNSKGSDHFVVATEKTTQSGQATYKINDPIFGITTLFDHYNNDYSGLRLYSGTSADLRTLRVSAHSPVELLITDPIGRKSGFDPITNTAWNEIPNSSYTVDSIEPDNGANVPVLEDKFLEIISPLDGNYKVDVIGTGQGSYEINIFASDWFGNVSSKIYNGIADVDSIDTETTFFSSYSGVGPPTVPYILRASENPSSADNVDFTAFFSQPVAGVDISDFTLTTSGVIGALIASVNGTGDTYTITVNTGAGNGTIRLDVVDDNSVIDAANNPLGGVNVGDGDYTGGETYTVIKGSSFADVPSNYWAWQYIERLYNAGITGGCSTTPLNYCPDSTVTRAQMAVFLLKGVHGSSYTPPAVGASTGFADVPTSYWAAPWIKQLAAVGITGGCGGGNYCPDTPVTRAQMAVFLLKSKHGVAYLPPAASGVFNDVPVGYWADKWIEQLAAEGITGGCGGGNYCPDTPVTRAQMAVFLVKTFNLP